MVRVCECTQEEVVGWLSKYDHNQERYTLNCIVTHVIYQLKQGTKSGRHTHLVTQLYYGYGAS